jgi:hypothetical protein
MVGALLANGIAWAISAHRGRFSHQAPGARFGTVKF